MTPILAAIDLEVVASTIAAARSLESPELADLFVSDPGLVEVLCFIQGCSIQPGGLGSFVRGMVQEDPLATNAGMLTDLAELVLNGRDEEQIVSRLLDAPHSLQRILLGDLANTLRQDMGIRGLGFHDDEDDYLAVRSRFISNARKHLHEVGLQGLLLMCREEALDQLPRHFTRLCTEPNPALYSMSFWFSPDPLGALRRAMERHALNALAGLADTSIREKVMDALDYAWSCRQAVWVHGNPRLGKSSTLGCYCNAHLGRARLVTVPCSDSDLDLVRAIADSLGIHYARTTSGWQLRESIVWVLRNTGMLIAFDEVHFLFPAKVSNGASPSRLNWVRTEVIDRGIPCVLSTTPQGYQHAQRRFQGATKYPMEQWLGRAIFRVDLPESPAIQDAQRVVEKLIPGLAEDLATELASRALAHDGGLKAIEAVAVRGAYLARKDGRGRASQADTRRAMEEMIPDVCQAPADLVQPPCSPEPEMISPTAPRRGGLRQIRPPVEALA